MNQVSAVDGWKSQEETTEDLTGVVADVSVDGQFADVERLNHVRVPFPPVIDVVEHVVHGFCRNILANHPTLRAERW